ncbi:hypothetical protein PIB30_045866 [Stylosanthes scabra]|uniref:Uncharacterized protein n=1 Tax=Stylosanthes scabra TaxID=79078 RepID=A0ABU6ZF12_9FABA|nr:hypothetical protein [Stylosanthes scabra]
MAGCKIHASIPKMLMSTWSDSIKVFNIYNLRDFVVVDKRARVRPTQVRWCSTLIFRILNLVAEVVGKEDPRDLITQTGKETKRMTINLQDLE